MIRKQNFQTVAWFWDLYVRKRLDLDPPYQRRSVWNQNYRDFFIDTVLLSYPAPAIFLYEQISPDGQVNYFVVDGKQRLSTLFSFLNNEFPIFDKATRTALAGKLFKDLSDDIKREFWSYQFTVEYLPSNEDGTISNIFDRINRNTAKLTAQELRHAKFSGRFITRSEEAAEKMVKELGENFPNIGTQARRQMKDVEFAASLLLLIEQGPQGFSTAQLDEAFSQRDDEWEEEERVIADFDLTISVLRAILAAPGGAQLRSTRLRNQADFYSLVGAVSQLSAELDCAKAAKALMDFTAQVSDEGIRALDKRSSDYYEAARSASNDAGPRKSRIDILRKVIEQSQQQ